MKLRQKSYVLTVVLVTAALYACTFGLLVTNIRATFRAAESRALGEEKALALAIDGMLERTPKQNRAAYVRGFALYDGGGATCELGRGGETWLAIEPVPPTVEPGRVRWIAQSGRTVLAIADVLSDGVWLRYGLDVTDVVHRMIWQTAGAMLICTLLIGSTALADLNAIRSNRGASPLSSAGKADVALERRLELNFEGHLWFDLDRTGGSISYSDANVTRNIPAGDKFWALPIPKSQVDINENLKQNPGYGE